MTTEVLLMIISGLGMIALIVHKHLETARGFETPVQDVRAKTDPILSNLSHETGRIFSYFTVRNAMLFGNWAFVHVVKFFMDASHRVHSASSRIVEKASKKTEDLSKAGAASFYLKQIKESKDGSLPPTTDAQRL